MGLLHYQERKGVGRREFLIGRGRREWKLLPVTAAAFGRSEIEAPPTQNQLWGNYRSVNCLPAGFSLTDTPQGTAPFLLMLHSPDHGARGVKGEGFSARRASAS